MRYAATKDIFSYWDKLRANRRAPDRHELSPAGFGRRLPDLFLLEREPTGEFRFRIAGSRLCQQFDRELRGVPVFDVFSHASLADARDMLTAVTEDVLPVVAGVSALLPGHPAQEGELLLLPLMYGETSDSRILGAYVPRAGGRSAAGNCAGLEVLSFRILTEVDIRHFHAPVPEVAEITPKDRRSHLRVITGGLS